MPRAGLFPTIGSHNARKLCCMRTRLRIAALCRLMPSSQPPPPSQISIVQTECQRPIVKRPSTSSARNLCSCLPECTAFHSKLTRPTFLRPRESGLRPNTSLTLAAIELDNWMKPGTGLPRRITREEHLCKHCEQSLIAPAYQPPDLRWTSKSSRPV